jgi:predicted RNA binding protein YcfA (HicA-like mRNA interferase family)
MSDLGNSLLLSKTLQLGESNNVKKHDDFWTEVSLRVLPLSISACQRPRKNNPMALYSSPQTTNCSTDKEIDFSSSGDSKMKVRQLLQALSHQGWGVVRTKGSHRQLHHQSLKGTVTVSGHINQDLPIGTLKYIQRQAQGFSLTR